jgi:ATPase
MNSDKMTATKFLPDSSVIVNGQLMDLIDLNQLYSALKLEEKSPIEFIYSHIVLAELENQANQDKDTGSDGISLLQDLNIRLSEMNKKGHTIVFSTFGSRPTLDQIKLNSGGELDAAIRRHALDSGATLISGDKVQYKLATIEQIPAIYLPQKEVKIPYEKSLDKFFDDTSMSVHLIAGVPPYAKKGKPGKWVLQKISENPLSSAEILELTSNILKEARADPHSFIEKQLKGVTVVQLRKYRIVICGPPFSNQHEITAVKPLVRLTMEDYALSDPLLDRLAHAEGILVAGRPGAGKSTFISALADFYLEKKKVIKTLESVRDLQVPAEVTQYTELEDDFEKTSDILLLVRPDYTIFDEIRTSDDFKTFSDMRLAGVGMIGVVHAASALDAIQRFIRRIELGVIPAILDTVVFVKKGAIHEVLKLEMTVKTPYGMRDADLARPVVEISDYGTNKLLYEIYEFGSNIVVIPVTKNSRGGSGYYHEKNNKYYSKKKPISAKKTIWQDEYEQNIDHFADNGGSYFQDEDERDSNTNFRKDDLIQKIGADIHDVLKFYIIYGKKSLVLRSSVNHANRLIDVYANDEFIASATLNKKGEVRFDKQSHMFHKLDNALQGGKHIYGIITRK